VPNDGSGLQAGDWSEAELSETVREFPPALGADTGVDREVRFLSGVVKVIRARRAEPDSEADARKLAVFLLHPAGGELVPGERPVREPLIRNGVVPLTRRVWFVGEAVNSGRYLDLADRTDDEIFEAVTGPLALGHVPAIVFDPRPTSAVALYYPRGLAKADDCSDVALGGVPLDISDVLQTVDVMYQRALITPERYDKRHNLWEEPAKWYPVQHAEEEIQSVLRSGLQGRYPACKVNAEQRDVAGRLDIEIEELDPLHVGHVVRHAILELKVLRSFGSTGIPQSPQYTLDWVESGVKQAAKYRQVRNAVASALCCFDMRTVPSGETCFDHVKTLAAQLQVHLRVWFLFASSSAFRDATT
jgi:hypothetical protein